MDKDRTIMLLEERISFLTMENKAALQAFETALDLNAFTASLTGFDSVHDVLRETTCKLRSMEHFGALAFFLVRETDSSLYLAFGDPPEKKEVFEKTLDPLIEDRTVAWALRAKKAVMASLPDKNSKLFLHSFSSPSKVLGLFCAMMDEKDTLEGNHKPAFPEFTTIILATAAGLVDNLLLRAQINDLNITLQEKIFRLEQSREELSLYRENLEREVKIRTRQLGRANEELRKEIDERRRMEAEVLYRANHDNLTGLANRDLFTVRLQEAMDEEEAVAVLFMDLDGFKGINDTLGHDVGDQLLQKIARRLSREVGEKDTVARMGGDEFTVVIPSPSSRKSVGELADRILKSVAKKTALAEQTIAVTASIGISLFPDHGTTVQDLMKHADAAMYIAKDGGKNKWIFWENSP